jgi:hypothetical protein
MRSAPSILHVSKTPLVGAPGKIACALERHSAFRAASIIGEDYPAPLKGLFVGDAILYSEEPMVHELCADMVRRADVIHVHNDLTDPLVRLLAAEARTDCRFVYQVHSPLREGPLFFDRSATLGFEWAAKLSIPHYPQRFFSDYRLVPNIVIPRASVRVLGGESVRVVFSPAHRRQGLRWGDKVSDELKNALVVLRSMRAAEVYEVRGMSPGTLMELRRTTHITIDEIATGAFHQVSLEGLCAGNVVVNAADYFALASLRMAVRAEDDPPFVCIEPADAGEALLDLVRDRDRIRQLQRASHEYYETYLRPERLVTFFDAIYEEALDVR